MVPPCELSKNEKKTALLQDVRIIVPVHLSLKFNSHARFELKDKLVIKERIIVK